MTTIFINEPREMYLYEEQEPNRNINYNMIVVIICCASPKD